MSNEKNTPKIETKTIIEDVVARHEGRTEVEIPDNPTIQFTIGNTKLSCKATEQGLEISKINHSFEDDRVTATCIAGNVILIK